MTDDESDPFEDARQEELAAIPVERKKRKKSMSPTARTLAECRKRGWPAQVVERWNVHARVLQDLFGVIDLVAIVPPTIGEITGREMPGAILGIQATSEQGGGHHANRRAKILAEPRARAWVEAGGRLELWSWAKRGGAGKRKLWTLRVEAFTSASWSATPAGSDTRGGAGAPSPQPDRP